MSVAETIIEGMTQAQVLNCIPPDGTEKCPVGRIRIGVFFDGTNNSMWRDWPHGAADGPEKKWGDDDNGPTNVAKLWKVFREELPLQKRVYHHGVGTDSTVGLKGKTPGLATNETSNESWPDWMGNAFGNGGKARVQWGMDQLAHFFSAGKNELAVEKLIDTYGFSRGAAIARDFVNTVLTQRVDNTNHETGKKLEVIGYGEGSQVIEVTTYRPHTFVYHEFLGVWDTVGSFGAGGPAWADSAAGYNFQIDHTQVRRTVHMMAEDEIRGNFPVTSLFQEPPTQANHWNRKPITQPQNMKELWYPGVHCDVGGAYLNVPFKKGKAGYSYPIAMEGMVYMQEVPPEPDTPRKCPELAHIPLHDMHKASLLASVPLNPLPEDALHKIPGDLASQYGAYDGFRSGKKYDLHGVYIQTWDSEVYRHFREERAAAPQYSTLNINYVHDSRWLVDKSYGRKQRTVHYMAPQKG